jgi:glucose/mannose transport system permease protein
MSTLLKTSSSGPSKIGLKWRYFLLIPLILMSIFYLIPLYVMVVTGLNSFDEVSLLTMWDLPKTLGFDNFRAAFENLAPSLWNSFKMVIPAAIISSFVGSI